MKSQKLILIRGLPGAGKSTLAQRRAKKAVHLEADTYFLDSKGVYRFDPKKLADAHKWCQASAYFALQEGKDVCVSNTFTQRWEMEPYFRMAEEFNAKVEVLDIFDGGLTDKELAERNLHGVPQQAIAQMRARYEHNWRRGDPRPPWER